MKAWKRNLSKVLALMLCLGSLNLTTVSAQENEDFVNLEETMVSGTLDGEDECAWDGVTMENVYEAINYKVYFNLTDYWTGGYRAEITIENIDEEDIDCWYLQFPFEQEISSIWNASVCQNKDGEITVKNAGWNHKIVAKNSVSFGICAVEDFKGFPKSYELIGGTKEISEEKYELEYYVDDEWEDGYTAGIAITNTSDEVLEDWMLTFDFAREIDKTWCES